LTEAAAAYVQLLDNAWRQARALPPKKSKIG